MKNELKILFRNDFLSFARKAIRELSGTKVGDDPYLEYLATELRDFIDGDTKRLLVNIPSRHLKTYLFSICLSAWEFARRPSAKIMVVTYADQLAEMIARAIRGILQSAWFKETFQTRLDRNHSAVMDFATTAGGALYAASFGGSITGRGADLIIVDDPHDIKDAGNPDQLKRAIQLFETVVLRGLNNRKADRAIVIAHRVHEDDLSGHLLGQGIWRHIVLPMVAISDMTYNTDYGRWDRRKGDLLRPDAFDPRDIEHLKKHTHNPDFDLLYQQDADSSALPPITPDRFPTFTGVPFHGVPTVLSVDPGAASGRRSSFSVVQLWCRVGDNHYLLDQWRKQCDFDELQSCVRKYVKFRRPSAILVERAANGFPLISLMKRNQHLIHEIIPDGSKSTRLRRNIDTVLNRRILLPANAPWRPEFIAENVRFPHGEFSDQVDTMTQYLDFTAKNPNLQKPPQTFVGVRPPRLPGGHANAQWPELLPRKPWWPRR
jgi:predicted phage terminase large subunit-like protein